MPLVETSTQGHVSVSQIRNINNFNHFYEDIRMCFYSEATHKKAVFLTSMMY